MSEVYQRVQSTIVDLMMSILSDHCLGVECEAQADL